MFHTLSEIVSRWEAPRWMIRAFYICQVEHKAIRPSPSGHLMPYALCRAVPGTAFCIAFCASRRTKKRIEHSFFSFSLRCDPDCQLRVPVLLFAKHSDSCQCHSSAGRQANVETHVRLHTCHPDSFIFLSSSFFISHPPTVLSSVSIQSLLHNTNFSPQLMPAIPSCQEAIRTLSARKI